MGEMPFYEVNQAITYAGGEDLNKCMQCGLCAAVCPWREVDGKFIVRNMIRQGQIGLEGYETDDILYGCTTCNRCVINCPREVKIIDIIRAMRSMIVETGAIPDTLKTVLGSCHSNGNPWSEPRSKRLDWTEGLDVPRMKDDTEYLLFVCCTSCYDNRSRRIAQSTVEVLKKAGVSFGIIGAEESCCGESVRKIGDEEGFNKLAKSNIKLFKETGVRKIITTSPHCYHTFSKEYPELGGDFEVVHSSELMARLVLEGKLKIGKGDARRIAYHDPCYLGRHSGIFDQPRDVIRATGAELVEMDREKNFSLCCGGGGGRLWMETKTEDRFSNLRVKEASEAGADVLVTACPYCISMLEDSRKTTDMVDKIELLELSELVARNLQ